jgi:uncharacterized membrane protein
MSTRWLWHLGAALALAAAVHLGALWLLPRFIMQRVLAGVAAEQPADAPLLPPPSDHSQRRVVMPSPDLLYALCAFDLERGPLRVSAAPVLPAGTGYWSVALYASNTDNFFVVGDRQLAGRALELDVIGPQAELPVGAAGVVRSPSTRGLLLMRVLVGDRARDAPAAETARRTLRCAQGG